MGEKVIPSKTILGKWNDVYPSPSRDKMLNDVVYANAVECVADLQRKFPEREDCRARAFGSVDAQYRPVRDLAARLGRLPRGGPQRRWRAPCRVRQC